MNIEVQPVSPKVNNNLIYLFVFMYNLRISKILNHFYQNILFPSIYLVYLNFTY